MLNFAASVNVSTGEVPGCLTPSGATPTLYHAKPIVIQGAYLAARASGNFSLFAAYDAQFAALLRYWDGPQRLDPATGLRFWHDQLEVRGACCVCGECVWGMRVWGLCACVCMVS